MEIWKEIKEYEGLYEISNYGNVRNNKGYILKPFDNKGYERIPLYKNGKTKKFLIHRLVAIHFISEVPFEGAQVNHKDLNRKNNLVENLEWVNGSENVTHSVENRVGRKDRMKKNMSRVGKVGWKIGVEACKKPVKQIDKNTNEAIATFESARDAAKETGSNYKNISQVCNGEKKTHNGYIWEFADKEGQTTIENTLIK